MAKVRKIPGAFVGTRGVPAQYTTDPDVATPEQVASIGAAIDKARRLSRGEKIASPLQRVAPLATSPVRLNSTGTGTNRAPAGALNLGIAGGATVANSPVGMNATSKGSTRAPGSFKTGLGGGRGTLRVEPVALIGAAIDKARRLTQGRVIGNPVLRVRNVANSPAGVNISGGTGAPARQTPNAGLGGGTIATSPSRVNRSGGNQSLYPSAPNAGFTNGTAPVIGNTRTAPSSGGSVANSPVGFNATSKAPQGAGGAFKAGLGGGRGTLRIQPDISKLTEAEAASLKMLESSLVAKEQDPKQNDDFVLLQEILGRKQLVDPEQNRLKALFRRMDNLYHPETMTLGGADHWSQDPSARLAGRAHVSVNIHHAYVQIPAAIQAVRPIVNYVPTGQQAEDRKMAQMREQLYFRWWEANDMDLQHEQAALLKELYGHTAAKVYWDPIERVPKDAIDLA